MKVGFLHQSGNLHKPSPAGEGAERVFNNDKVRKMCEAHFQSATETVRNLFGCAREADEER